MNKKWKKLIFQLLPRNKDFGQFFLTVALKLSYLSSKFALTWVILTQLRTTQPTAYPPPEKELIGTRCVAYNPLFTCKIDYIYNLADRRSEINRQEGGIAASKVCLKALPLSLPSPPNVFPLSPNREPVHRLHVYVAYSKLYKGKKRKAEHTLCLKSDIYKISKVAIYQNLRNVTVRNNPAFNRHDFVPSQNRSHYTFVL